MKCPGQDQRFWKPEDIFEQNCPNCGTVIEFWKDEPKVKCPGCKAEVPNPKICLGCADWCPAAEQCNAVRSTQKKSKNNTNPPIRPDK